jgi:hypothetical protein
VEGRRDPDVAPSAGCRLAREASRPFEVDVAGPGVAGPARRTSACWKSSAAYWPHTRRRVSVAFGNKTLATSRMPRVTTAAGSATAQLSLIRAA